jgi:hypothetical protein
MSAHDEHSPMAQVLGPQWAQLHPTLRAHHRGGTVREVGTMDVEFPRWMTPVLWLIHGLGALVPRAQPQVHTVVDKRTHGGCQSFDRTLTFADDRTVRFNSIWAAEPGARLVEYVKPWLALELAAAVQGDALHCEGVCFLLGRGRLRIRLSERWLLGHTVIHESAIDAKHYAMDFRMIHPWFGQVFRYAGTFATDPASVE